MKNSKTILTIIIALVSAVMLPNCQPESAKVYIPRETGNVASVTGVWKGVSVTQRDIDAETKNFPYKSQDITAVLDFTKVTLTLNSSSNLPGTFAINYGTAPAFFKLTGGSWKVDNVGKIGALQLYNGLDTVKFSMGNYLLIDQDKLQIVQTKYLSNGTPVVTYEFNFSK